MTSVLALLVLLMLLVPAGGFLLELGRDAWDALRRESESVETAIVRQRAEIQMAAIKRATIRRLITNAADLQYPRRDARDGGDVIDVDPDDVETSS